MNRPSFRVLRLAAAVLLGAGCSAGATDLKAPIPEDLANPTNLHYSGLTRQELVDIASVALDELGLTAIQADRSRGYVETAFTDVADFNYLRQAASNYPPRERLIQIQLSIRQIAPENGAVEVVAYYRPFRPLEDRPIPRDHPGYAVLNAVIRKLQAGIVEAAGTVTRRAEG